jgi:hypothetical protein
VPLENREFNYRKVCYDCSVNMKVTMPPKESCLEVLFYAIFVTKVGIMFKYSK